MVANFQRPVQPAKWTSEPFALTRSRLSPPIISMSLVASLSRARGSLSSCPLALSVDDGWADQARFPNHIKFPNTVLCERRTPLNLRSDEHVAPVSIRPVGRSPGWWRRKGEKEEEFIVGDDSDEMSIGRRPNRAQTSFSVYNNAASAMQLG